MERLESTGERKESSITANIPAFWMMWTWVDMYQTYGIEWESK